MSCEGFYQCFCKNRHYDTIGNLDERLISQGLDIQDLPCEECGEPFVWVNFVDDTNCDGFGKVEINFDEDGLVAIHSVTKLLQAQQQKDTGFHHSCGNWTYRRRHGQSDIVISAAGFPVIAIVPLEHVSIKGQIANARSICAVPEMIEIIDRLAKHRGMTMSCNGNHHNNDLNEIMGRAEEMINYLKSLD